MTVAGLLLAAGASRRFGAEDKLLSDLRGQPLVTHAACALRSVQLGLLIGVSRSNAVADLLTGFDIVIPQDKDPSQSDSLRAGVTYAAKQGASHAVIVLGDMPFVSPELIQAVIAKCTETRAAAASSGLRPMPPACFPKALFPELLGIRGDQGAGDLLKRLPREALVPANDESLQDIDTPEALAKSQT